MSALVTAKHWPLQRRNEQFSKNLSGNKSQWFWRQGTILTDVRSLKQKQDNQHDQFPIIQLKETWDIVIEVFTSSELLVLAEERDELVGLSDERVQRDELRRQAWP